MFPHARSERGRIESTGTMPSLRKRREVSRIVQGLALFFPCAPPRRKTWRKSFLFATRTNAKQNVITPCHQSGEGGIRTRGGVAPTQHFQCCTIGRSATSPESVRRVWPSHCPHRTADRQGSILADEASIGGREIGGLVCPFRDTLPCARTDRGERKDAA